MELDFGNNLKQKINIKGDIKKIKEMVKVYTDGQMEIYIMDSLKMI
jgi:hypothetical protein